MEDINLENEIPPISALLVTLLLLFSPPFLGALCHLSNFGNHWGEFLRALRWGLILKGLLYSAGLYFAIIFPCSYCVLEKIEEKRVVLRTLVGCALVLPPVMAFGYYVGQFSSGFEELWLTVLPPVFIGSYFYARTSRAFWFALFVSVATFVPFFVLNDILGPFPEAIPYFPTSPSFAWVKIAMSLGAVLYAFYGLRRWIMRGNAEASRK